MKPLLIISLALNALAVAAALGMWLNRIPIFGSVIHQLRTAAATTFFAAYPITPDDIVMVGDSITANGHWAEIFPDVPLKNRGVSADMTADLLKRLSQVTDGHPRKAFLLIGTNDIGLGARWADTLRNYAQILDRFIDDTPETQLYVQSVLPREAENRDKVLALNVEIMRMAEQRDLTYIDLFPAFADEAGVLRDELTYDSLHLTGEGYRLWHDLIAARVKGADIAPTSVHPGEEVSSP